MTKRLPEFEIQARIKVVTSVYIAAENMADALERAKEMRETDFIKFEGEYLDGNYEVIGVTAKDGWKLE